MKENVSRVNFGVPFTRETYLEQKSLLRWIFSFFLCFLACFSTILKYMEVKAHDSGLNYKYPHLKYDRTSLVSLNSLRCEKLYGTLDKCYEEYSPIFLAKMYCGGPFCIWKLKMWFICFRIRYNNPKSVWCPHLHVKQWFKPKRRFKAHNGY